MPLLLPDNTLSTTQVSSAKLFWTISSVGLLFGYLSHLGTLPLDITTDEPRRALVSLEMLLSGNYVVPTLNGEPYLNKPPFYNWIIIAFVKVFGNFSMFMFRLPVIISLAIMSYCVFYYTRKYTDNMVAFFTAFAFASNGRIIIYDSLQGLIDITFALIVYLNFMVIFSLGERQKYRQLFLISYLLTALGFLTKGFPMLVFEGITMACFFAIQRKTKLLFTTRHLLGIGVFLLITGVYFFIYYALSGISPVALVDNLLHESAKRTPLGQGLKRVLTHLVLFPLEFVYHFAPWTIFLAVLFKKSALATIRNNSFVFYSSCIYLANISVYWLSPDVYPRYLFMFLPLLFLVLFYLFFQTSKAMWPQKFIKIFVLVFCATLAVACFIFPFTPSSVNIKSVALKSVIIGFVLAGTFVIALRHRQQYLYAFVVAIIVARVGFNLLVLDQRGASNSKAEEIAIKIAALSQGSPLYLHRNIATGNFDGMSYHISKSRKEILRYRDQIAPEAYYITDSSHLKNRSYTAVFQFQIHESDPLMLVRYR